MRLLISWLILSSTSAFLPSSRHGFAPKLWLQSPQKEDVDALRDEIAELKAEALRRMEALNAQFSSEADVASTASTSETTLEAPLDTIDYSPRVAVSNAPASREESSSNTAPSTPRSRARDSLNLLDGTRWKVMLNIGREQGTWMPKTWGASGERLLLNGEVDFDSQQLYDREEFLNGITNAKQLKVHHLYLGPTMTEDSREIKVKELGGWRVAQGEGPMGTDILRFYIEIEEDVRHQGGDVYCPKGRVYCTCGYFPIQQQASGLRDRLREEQERLSRQYDDLSAEMESANMWDKIKIGKQLMEVRMEAGRVAQQLNEARVREPERELLRLSRKGDVGLTKEGGVCCKVTKGLALEYHILGKFGVASVDKREDPDDDTPSP